MADTYLPEPRILWHSDYWDGYLTGLCLYQDRKCWFRCVDSDWVKVGVDEDGDDDLQEHRTFEIVELSPDELAELEQWHDLFRQLVGGHTDYNEQGKRDLSKVNRSKESKDKYYELAKDRVRPTFTDNKVLGRFRQ